METKVKTIDIEVLQVVGAGEVDMLKEQSLEQ